MDSFYKCLQNKEKNEMERFKNSEALNKKANPLIQCLKQNGIHASVWGSVAKKMARPKSDVDVVIKKQNQSRSFEDIQDVLEHKCGGFTLDMDYKACDIVYKFKSKQHPDIDLTFNKCPEENFKYDLYPQLTLDHENILYCLNKSLRSSTKKKKFYLHSDFTNGSLNVNHDTHIKERRYPKKVKHCPEGISCGLLYLESGITKNKNKNFK